MSIIKELQTISNDKSLSVENKLESLLRIGTDILGLETGIISNIRGELYSVLSVVTPKDDIEPNRLFNLSETYCAEVVELNSLIAYHNINEIPGASHPCFEKYSLKSYLAAPIYVGGELFGTVNFSSLSPKHASFTSLELDYLLLLASWVGNELERQQAINNLNAQKSVLAERNLLLNQVINLAGVGTWEFHLETRVFTWSDALKRMLHLHSDKILKAEDIIKFIVDERERERYVKRFKQMLKTGDDFSYELKVRTDAGETRWIESRAHPVMENGRCIKVIGATIDITQIHIDRAELKQKSEMARKEMATRGDFLSNISYQIRTPLHDVQGMLEVLIGSRLNSKQLEFATIAMKGADSLLGIVNNILDFSKIDSESMSYKEEPTNIAQVIEEQTPMFAQLAQEKGIALSVNTSGVRGKNFVADKLRIGQVFINLVNNAFKFTKEGTVSVEAKCTVYGKGRYRVKLIVTDSGIGISKQQQKLIFSPFKQGANYTERESSGVGVGLALVKKVAEYYNGKVEVSSELGVGARFTVTLTLNDANALAISETASGYNFDYTPSREELSSFKVLIVEDNEINQLVIKEQLREIGLASDLAVNGQEAVDKVKRSLAEKSPYSIILMDCHMPIMDGVEATKQIRLLDHQTNELLIIALTANTLRDDKQKYLKSGMNDFISKPVGVSRLKECVFRYLGKQFENNVSALKNPA